MVFGWYRKNAPLSAAVESDIVGYTTIEMQAGKWYQIGTPFVDLGDKEEVLLNEVFSSGFSEGDTLCIFDSESSAYTSYLYWIEDKGAWCDLPIPSLATPSMATLPFGQAVYIHKNTSGQIVLSGKVEAKAITFGAEDVPVWAQIAPVWPVSCDVNDYAWEGLTQGDTLTVWDSDTSSYSAYAYWNETQHAWCDLPIPGIAKPISISLAPGQAVYISKQTGLATVKAPETANN